MRTSLLILTLLLAGTALPFWWSPYSASGRLSLALTERDEQVLAQAVEMEQLQRMVAYHARSNHSVQRNTTLDPGIQRAFDALVEEAIREHVALRTRPAEIWRLLEAALGKDLQGTRFERARGLLERGTLEWRDLSSVYVGPAQQVRLRLQRSGLVWRVAGLEFPPPKIKLQLGSGAARSEPAPRTAP
jgi:hypothetical protein